VRLKEVNKKLDMWCPKCGVFEYTTMYFHIERFRPLEQSENSEKKYDKINEPVPTLR